MMVLEIIDGPRYAQVIIITIIVLPIPTAMGVDKFFFQGGFGFKIQYHIYVCELRKSIKH